MSDSNHLNPNVVRAIDYLSLRRLPCIAPITAGTALEAELLSLAFRHANPQGRVLTSPDLSMPNFGATNDHLVIMATEEQDHQAISTRYAGLKAVFA